MPTTDEGHPINLEAASQFTCYIGVGTYSSKEGHSPIYKGVYMCSRKERRPCTGILKDKVGDKLV